MLTFGVQVFSCAVFLVLSQVTGDLSQVTGDRHNVKGFFWLLPQRLHSMPGSLAPWQAALQPWVKAVTAGIPGNIPYYLCVAAPSGCTLV